MVTTTTTATGGMPAFLTEAQQMEAQGWAVDPEIIAENLSDTLRDSMYNLPHPAIEHATDEQINEVLTAFEQHFATIAQEIREGIAEEPALQTCPNCGTPLEFSHFYGYDAAYCYSDRLTVERR